MGWNKMNGKISIILVGAGGYGQIYTEALILRRYFNGSKSY